MVLSTLVLTYIFSLCCLTLLIAAFWLYLDHVRRVIRLKNPLCDDCKEKAEVVHPEVENDGLDSVSEVVSDIVEEVTEAIEPKKSESTCFCELFKEHVNELATILGVYGIERVVGGEIMNTCQAIHDKVNELLINNQNMAEWIEAVTSKMKEQEQKEDVEPEAIEEEESVDVADQFEAFKSQLIEEMKGGEK